MEGLGIIKAKREGQEGKESSQIRFLNYICIVQLESPNIIFLRV